MNEPSLSSSTDSEELVKLRKERMKLSDERVEYNRLLRNEARKESYLELVAKVISDEVKPIENFHTLADNSQMSNNDLLCHLTDIHTGIHIDNFTNTFNKIVLKDRLQNYIDKVVEIKKLHHSENCYIVIGEILSGLIHNNLRIQNNMDLIQQFKHISTLISHMLIALSGEFRNIHVYVTPGNHSRVVAKKDDSLTGENMDILLPFYLKASLQNYPNINIHDNEVSDIARFNVRGNKVYSAHGDKDSPTNVVQNFTLMFGEKPDIILLGHRHTNGMTTISDTKVIQSGCVSGTDGYAVDIRKTNKPEQTISVVNEDGLVCLYDIQL